MGNDNACVVLTSMVESANAKQEAVPSGQGVPVTLFISGTIITGRIIPSWQYFEELGADAAETEGEGPPFQYVADWDKRARDELEELSRKPYVELKEDERKALDESGPRNINLANARFYAGNRMMPDNQTVPIRVRLDRVDAWILGEMGAGQPVQS